MASELSVDYSTAKGFLASLPGKVVVGKDGEDGGYYIPAVEQTGDNTMKVSFTPSKEGMPVVDAVEITLPGAETDPSQNGSGLTTAQINALDGMFKIASFTEDPTAAYAAFKTAFGIADSGEDSGGDDSGETEVTLTGISATYAGGDVAVGTALTDLAGIVVTAYYSDDSTTIVTDYTLSGEIAEGENTITVSYGGKTTSFAVTGIAETTTPFGVEWTEGYLVSVAAASTGELVANATWVTSDYIDVSGKTEVRVYNETGKLFTFQGAFLDAEKASSREDGWYFQKQYVQGSTAYPSPLVLAVPDGAAYLRLSTSIQAGSASAGYVRYDTLTYELA